MQPQYSKSELISAIILFVATMIFLACLMFTEPPDVNDVPMGPTGIPYMDIRSGSATVQSNGVYNAK